MVRSKIPGGRMTADQYLAHDRLADDYGNGSIRLTTRQDIQLHGVFMKDLREFMQKLNDSLVTTLGACGDVCRNTMCCPAPIRNDGLREQIYALTQQFTEHFLPRTSAYYDIWLNGSKVESNGSSRFNGAVEPLYGRLYLPRKFKIAITLPEDNCVDALSNDVALIAKVSKGEIVGYDVFAGGGMGMTHGMEKTYPRVATPVCYAPTDEVLNVVTAIVKLQRDRGNRQDRKQARLKYLIDKWGQEKFHDAVQDYYGKKLEPYSGLVPTGIDDHLGWHKQGDGKWWLGIPIRAGRIKDSDDAQIKSGLRKVIEKYNTPVHLTATQNLLLCDIDAKSKKKIDEILADHKIKPVSKINILERSAMACPAMPTCGLALSESENVLGKIVASIHNEMKQHGLGEEEVVIHMTGCPNGCARPYSSDIGIVGRQPGKYTIFLGGNKLGDEIAFQYLDLVPEDEIPAVLHGPFAHYSKKRKKGEGFGNFCQRIGRDELLALSEQDQPSTPAKPTKSTAVPAKTSSATVAESHGSLEIPLYFKGKQNGRLEVPNNLSKKDVKILELAVEQIKAYVEG